MSRPVFNDVAAGTNTWATIINDNLAKLVDGPLPVKTYADFASLPAAGSYDWSVAALEDEEVLVFSDGAAWHRIGRRAAAQADSTAAALADLVTDFNSLLAKLRTAKLLAP
jgi:hypothetical protein